MSIRGREEKASGLRRGTFFFVASAILVLDQLTKAWALRHLASVQSLPVFPSIFHLTLTENQGIAFGLFQNFEKILFFVITVSIGALTVIGFRSTPFRWKIQWGIGLILGGALGNWLDRIRLGAVIDFLDFRIWPVFNLADMAITVGVGIFLLDLLIRKHAA